MSASQRVIFCVYNESEELRLRAKIDEFEIATVQAGHKWELFDLTDSFAEWLTSQRYRKSYFNKPQLISTLLPRYKEFIFEKYKKFIQEKKTDENTVVSVKGIGSLFGFLKVKEIVDKIAPITSGRLLIFFPGSFEKNNYRLLDAYDGWNYLAVPITSDKEF